MAAAKILARIIERKLEYKTHDNRKMKNSIFTDIEQLPKILQCHTVSEETNVFTKNCDLFG